METTVDAHYRIFCNSAPPLNDVNWGVCINAVLAASTADKPHSRKVEGVSRHCGAERATTLRTL